LCQEAIKLSYLNPGRTGLIGAPTYPMLRDATMASLLEVLGKNGIPHDVNRAENFLVMRETRSKILFRAVEEFERLRGSNLAWFGLDELTYTQEEAWLRLEGRLRDPKASRLCGFAVWTPKGYDWVYERFVAARVKGYEVVAAQAFENRHLLERVPDYYERLKSSYDARFYQQEVLGQYTALQSHTLYLGTRYTGNGAQLSIAVDDGTPNTVDLRVPGEDVLIRWPVDEYGSGAHSITITHAGPAGGDFYFDFLELAVPGTTLPVFPEEPRMTLATDWDTDHSIALAPERTAWLIDTLGFKGRQNHYVGALWFYELVNPDNVYASGTVTFGGTPEPGKFVSIFLGRDDDGTTPTEIQRGMHPGETLESIAISYAQELNRGYTGVWASVAGSVVTIYSRSLGADGNHYTLDYSTTSSTLTVSVSATFSGGHTGEWRTDLTASPRLNRAVRDWNRSFFTALASYGIDVASAFSTELRDVDPSVAVGMVQRGPDGDAILLQTPAYQTNFSSTSLDFWKNVYLDAAAIHADAGLQPYLQFGEVQWWYFPNDGLGHAFSGMPFYDAWTAGQFLALYGRAMAVFTDNTADPASYPDEVAFLPTVIGDFTDAIMTFVRETYATARFEVLYPLDVNQTSFNRAVNYPASQWTAATLDCLKTEAFGFTLQRNLDKSEQAILLSGFPEFPAAQRSHLVGVGDPTTAWAQEAQFAHGRGFESVVLFALDQMCLVGYALPLPAPFRRSIMMGS